MIPTSPDPSHACKDNASILYSVLRTFVGFALLTCLALASADAYSQIAIPPVGNIGIAAGTLGTSGFSGDGGAATSALLYSPSGTALDSAGNLYIADTQNDVVRKVSAATGVISTIAGIPGQPGSNGDGGLATQANLYQPTGVAVDSSNNIYIADTTNNRIRLVLASTGKISTVAGNGVYGAPKLGTATSSPLESPMFLAVDRSGDFYFSDSLSLQVYKVDSSGTLSPVAGGGHPTGCQDNGGDGCLATQASFDKPLGIALDSANNLYIADGGGASCSVHVVSASTGIMSLYAGVYGQCSASGNSGTATTVKLSSPWGVAVDSAGNLYIADEGSFRVRVVNTAGYMSTLAGNGTNADTNNGQPATTASLYNPQFVSVDPNGDVFVTDTSNFVIRAIGEGASFVSVGNMTTNRYSHSATLLNNGTVLVAGGISVTARRFGTMETTLSSAEIYNGGAFSLTGSMTVGRSDHTASMLSNGTVLIAGGSQLGQAASAVTSTDVYSGTGFTAGPSMKAARTSHTATTLSSSACSNTAILIAGGSNSTGVLSSAELYNDGNNGTFSLLGSGMKQARTGHAAVLLNDCTVLIVGGFGSSGGALQSAEIYNPTSKTFTLVGSMNYARTNLTATLLPNHKVLIAGGMHQNCIISGCTGPSPVYAEIYDPSSQTFTLTGNAYSGHYGGTAALVTINNNQLVLVAGGESNLAANGYCSSAAELFDYTRGTFSRASDMSSRRASFTMTALSASSVLVAGGGGCIADFTDYATNTAQLFP